MHKIGRMHGRRSSTVVVDKLRRVKNQNANTTDIPIVISVPSSSVPNPRLKVPRSSSPKPRPKKFSEPIETRIIQVQTKPIGLESRVIMTNKACDATASSKEVAMKTGSTTSREQYNSLLLQQYGFNPSIPDTLQPLQPIEKVLIAPVHKVDYGSQCANVTTTTGTNGTTIDMAYNFGSVDEMENYLKNGLPGISPKDVEISETPRLKVIAEKFTRFKKDHIELRRLEERIICVEYDVYSRQDKIKKQPIQVMRAYFCVKTNCKECKNSGIFRTVPSSIRNSPLAEKEYNRTDLEKEVEMIEEDLPENKPYLKDLRAVLKKRNAMSAKKKKSSLDLMSMYNMAKNEMPPRDHDWSNTNLLSKAELQEVKDLILKKCESRMYNLSRKKIKVKEKNRSADSSLGKTGKSDSIYYELFRDFDSNPK